MEDKSKSEAEESVNELDLEDFNSCNIEDKVIVLRYKV
jgi:hypothetical protein